MEITQKQVYDLELARKVGIILYNDPEPAKGKETPIDKGEDTEIDYKEARYS